MSKSLSFSVAAGVATGLADAVFVVTTHSVYDPVRAWFVLPLAWSVLCLCVAVIFSIGPLRRALPGAVAFAGPGLLVISRLGTWLRLQTTISLALATALSVGVAVLLAWIASRTVAPPQRFERRLIVAPFVAAAFLGFCLFVTPHLFKTKTIAADSRKNVVLIFLDTLRYDDASTMRSLEGLGAHGAVFDNAWAPGPWTLPSHLAVLTGVDPWKVEFDSSALRFARQGVGLGEAFAARGYRTGAVFANALLRPQSGVSRGFEHIEVAAPSSLCASGVMHLVNRFYVHAGKRCPVCDPIVASHVTARAADFVEHAPRPYFMALNYLDVHVPYYVESKCRDDGSPAIIDAATRNALDSAFAEQTPLPRDVAIRARAQYRAAARCLDRSLADLFRTLEQQPDAQNTIIAVVGDHGEQFGRHGLVGHGNSLYRQLLHVPLIVSDPGAPAQRIADPVSISDLYWTLLHSAGLGTRRAGLFDAGRRAPVAHCQFEFGGVTKRYGFSAASNRYHVLLSSDGGEQIYDYVADPKEVQPLRNVDASQIEPLRKLIADANASRARTPIELRGLGYIQ